MRAPDCDAGQGADMGRDADGQAAHPVTVLIAGATRGLQPVKHEGLLQALRLECPDLQICDVEPSALSRALGLARTFLPDKARWRGRFNAHPAMFEARTAAVARWAARNPRQGPLLQIGVTFDAARAAPDHPVVIYTDYVALLTRDYGREWRQDLPEAQVARRLAQERAALSGARHICTRSHLVAEAIAAGHGVDRGRISVVGAGPNLQPAGPKAEPLRFLFVGAEFGRKGGDLVIAAFRQLVARLPDARLDVVAPARHRVDVAGLVWHVAPDLNTMRALLGAAGVVLVPSRFETWGDVLVEAMTGGAVPVISPRPPMTELVRHRETGIVLPDDTPEALCAAMLELAQDPPLRHRLGEAARAAMAQDFTMERVAARLAQRLRAADQPRSGRVARA